MASGDSAAPGVGQTQSRPCRSAHGSAVAQVRPDTVLPPTTCRAQRAARITRSTGAPTDPESPLCLALDASHH